MKSTWTIQRQVGGVFGLLLAVLAVLGINASWTLHTQNARAARDAQAMAATVHLGLLTMELSAAADMIAVAGFKQDTHAIDEEWASAEAGLVKLRAASDELAQATSVEANRDRARQIAGAMNDWQPLVLKAVELARAGKGAEASTAMEESEKYSDDTAAPMVTEVLKAELEHVADSHARATRAEWTMDVLVAIAAIVLSVVVVFVLRRVSRLLRGVVADLDSGAHQVVAASGQVSSASQSLSQGATEQAASLEETSASMEEMASMTRRNAENSQTAAQLMTDVDARVRGSNASLHEMVSSMSAIQESSQKVSKIIKTIDEIAFQTNILALNAAVEAARAGEAGMGFAVVADEVRNLAQRSAQAAKDTASLIEESIVKAQNGTAKVEQVSAAISGITDSVTKVKGLVDEVSVASRQQSQGIDQVSQAIAQMEKVTQTTAATAEESAAASEQLNAQAETTMSVVRQLDALVGGSGTAAPAHAAAAPAKTVRKLAVVPRVAPARADVRASADSAAEDALPLGDTGTYGRF